MTDRTSLACPKCGQPADRRWNTVTNMLEAGCSECELWIAQSAWNSYVRVIEDWKLRTAMSKEDFHRNFEAIRKGEVSEDEAFRRLVVPPYKRAN